MEIYKPNEFAKLIGVSVKTLQRWDNEHKLIAYRAPTGRRYYTHRQYTDYISDGKVVKGKSVIYARVSHNDFKDHLEKQIVYLEEYALKNDIQIDEVIIDISNGIHHDRANLHKMIEECMCGNISLILIAYKDRLMRYGYDMMSKWLETSKVVLVDLDNIEFSPKEEIIYDIASLLEFSRIDIKEYSLLLDNNGQMIKEIMKKYLPEKKE
ncbi:MAG: resolvase [Clostridiales bacterium]|jgi:predicted site-specific integrase-resolvase|nr:resolvase [Clostridiales bacterium]